MIKLFKNVKVFIPETNNEGKALEGKALDRFTEARNNFIEVCGGFTEYQAQGGWIEGGKLYRDSITILECGYEDTDNMAKNTNLVDAVINLVNAVMVELEQLAVSVKVNEKLLIIEDTDSRDDILKALIDLV